MGNYYANARSNYFKVKDLEKFEEWLADVEVELFDKNEDSVVITPTEAIANGCFPHLRLNKVLDEYEDLDFEAELAAHLQDGEVAVLMEAGNEKLCYLTGYAVAIHSSGKVVDINLDEIYAKAASEFGLKEKDIGKAEY